MSRRRKAAASGPLISREQHRGFSVEILVLALLVASPALYRSLVEDMIPLEVALQRFVLIAGGCWLIAWFVAAMLPAGGSSADGDGTPDGSTPGQSPDGSEQATTGADSQRFDTRPFDTQGPAGVS